MNDAISRLKELLPRSDKNRVSDWVDASDFLAISGHKSYYTQRSHRLHR